MELYNNQMEIIYWKEGGKVIQKAKMVTLVICILVIKNEVNNPLIRRKT